jgi:cation transport ATPase
VEPAAGPAGRRVQLDVRRPVGYTLPAGTGWVSPVLGTVVFVYGGWPFLTGAVSELRSRQPGMMLLVAMAITVAFVASGLASLGICRFAWTSGGSSPSWS